MRTPWIVVFLSGCFGSSGGGEPLMFEEIPDRYAAVTMTDEEDVAGTDWGRAEPEAPGAAPPRVRPSTRGARAERSSMRPMSQPAANQPAPPPADEGEGEAVALRQWFPESFLWQPLVETGPDGTAEVPVTVPDQLTTWRVLALANDRGGSQAGTLATFDSTLPAYVDLAVPGWLYVGDRVELPVQVVAHTADVSGQLVVQGEGALAGGGTASVNIAAGGSGARTLTVRAEAAGVGTVRADLPGVDALERQIQVVPRGRPDPRAVGAVLSSSRALALRAPDGADPRTQELFVAVYPGPLALFGTEIERLGAGTAPLSPGYGLDVAHGATELAEAAGVEVDAAALRRVRLVSWQRVVRLSRAPSAVQAADLLVVLRGVDGEEAEVMRARMARTVASGQRADGTWAPADRSTLQAVLVHTAWVARALPEDDRGPRLRAAGALERYASDVTDPYTAAVVLASGLVSGDSREALREQVREGLVQREDGRVSVTVPADARSPWGYRPSQEEALAWAWLALEGEPEAADVLAELLGRYRAEWGFGAGPADAVALEVVRRGLPALDAEVEVSLQHRGEVVATASLDPSQPRVPAVLVAPTSGDAAEWEVSVSPAVPGLALRGELRSWIPWSGDEELPGVEVSAVPRPLTAGRPGAVDLELVGPSGAVLTVDLGLPPGASVDESTLDSQRGVLADFAVYPDHVHLVTRALGAGEVLEVEVALVPALAGELGAAPTRVAVEGHEALLPPVDWTIR